MEAAINAIGNSGAAGLTMAGNYHRGDAQLSGRKFYRVKDRAWFAGVCSGVAHYFGFNLKVTRILTVIGAMFLGPVALLVYIGVMFLVPSRRLPPEYLDPVDAEFLTAMRARPVTTIGDVRRRYQNIESRLARLERHVTSPRYNLEQEINRL